jgi:hypothetical protein
MESVQFGWLADAPKMDEMYDEVMFLYTPKSCLCFLIVWTYRPERATDLRFDSLRVIFQPCKNKFKLLGFVIFVS